MLGNRKSLLKMYEPREEVEEVQQFGNLDAAVDQLVFARSKEKKDKMKGDSEAARRSGGHDQGGARFNRLYFAWPLHLRSIVPQHVFLHISYVYQSKSPRRITGRWAGIDSLSAICFIACSSNISKAKN